MRLTAFLALLLAPAGAAHAATAGLNLVSKVEVKDGGETIVLAIEGSKPPNFTTFSMVDPPRFVIDLSESAFKNVPEDIQVGDGTINVVKNLSYGSDATAIARVMIAFLRDVDPPELETRGTTLLVKIAKPAAARAAVAAAEPAPAAVHGAAAAPAIAAVPAGTSVKIAAQAQPAVDRDAQARADAEAKAKAEAEARVKADAEAQARADAEAKARAEAEARARTDVEAKAERDAQAKAAAQKELEAQARVEAQARTRTEDQARQDRENEEAKAWKEARRVEEQRLADEGKVKVTRLSEAATTEEQARKQADAEEHDRAAAEARVHVLRAKEARARESGQPFPPADAKALADAEKALADAQARLQADAEQRRTAANARAEAEAQQQAAAESAKAEREDLARAESEKAKARAEADAQAEAERRAQAAREEQTRNVAVARALEKANRGPGTVEGAKAEAPRAVEVQPIGQQAEARAEAKPSAEARERAAAEREASQAAAREAKAKARVEREEQARALAADARPRQIREVGFKQLSAASRVYVRVSETPRFNIVEAGEKLIRLELPNTRVLRKNDERFLDTSFFPGAVAMVTPKRSGTGIVLEIALKEKVPYQQRVEGDTLSIDFERPAIGPSAAAPAAPAAEPAAN